METLKLNRSEQETLELRQLGQGVGPLFGDKVKVMINAKGLRQGEAIRTAAKLFPNEYNTWCKRGRPNFL